MTTRRGRWLWLGAAALLVVGLAGGRGLALETAERAWAASLGVADVYLDARALARLMQLAVLALAVGWGTANLLVVYRAIGSVQMPRRLGDLEIVETVPHAVLLSTTIASGVVFGLVLTWGTGDWWLTAALAGAAPVFGVVDPILQRDAGYYVGPLPWAATVQDHVLVAVLSVGVIVALLYYGMGSLRRVDGEWRVSAHARTHLGVLLACGAAALAWGAALDPAEVVAGLHGPVHQSTLEFRVAGAPLVTAAAAATALVSLVWSVFGHARILVGAWLVLGTGSLLVYTLLPGMGRSARGPEGARVAALDAARPAFEALAFGPRGDLEPLPSPPSLEAAIVSVPLWDPPHVAAAAHRRAEAGTRATVHPAGVALAGARQWLVAPAPDDAALQVTRPPPEWSEVYRGAWARTGPALLATEADTGLAFSPVPDAEPELWFGHGFSRFAVASPESTFAAGVTGIPLEGTWRRAALAWALQSAELARRGTRGLRLLWRRDVTERLSRLAPFAAFDTPMPVLLEGALWWVSYGYVRSQAFPLVLPATVDGRRVRYARAGVLGLVRGATGETRLFHAPGADSLTAAWGRVFAPLVRPWDSVPTALRARLPFPTQAFALAADRWRANHGDTVSWTRRPNAPYQLLVPPLMWTAQAFDAGAPPRVVALLAGLMTPRGPALSVWRPDAPVRLPPPVLGAPHLRAGPERLWLVEGVLFALQAQFEEPALRGEPPRLRGAWASWGDRSGAGPTARLALQDLLAAGLREPPSAERWEEARRLLAQADSALAAGDVERFGRLYAALKQVLAVGRRQLAPPGRPR
jgi:hypothetical protein